MVVSIENLECELFAIVIFLAKFCGSLCLVKSAWVVEQTNEYTKKFPFKH